MAINKVIFNGNTLIDLTNDTVAAANLLVGASAHGRDGNVVNGACPFDADTSDATATAAEILAGSAQNPITAYVNGVKVTGTMPNNGGTGATISDLTDISVPRGYYDGSGVIAVADVEKAKIIPGNIRSGVEILGITGDYAGESATAQSKTVTPTALAQTVLPDTGYDYLSQVVVNAIPYVETANAYGTTVTIG